MQIEQPWYISLRAEALATVFLTERDDLIVLPQQKDKGLDLLVTITKNGNPSGRLFGVEVKATASSSELTQDNENYNLRKNGFNSTNFFRDLPFPVCLFFFTLDNDQGYYKWILEPIVKSQNNIGLHLNESDELKKITDKEIANIISLVNSWYDNKSNLRQA
ncbi:DUF4365 domain-containing protein [Calothrix sp. PCC 7507]|uniref:DUF4365 domain-containing protein n=1 Tax=Calothrix sp. PCC 7507 TaxID=99598 RepID=UPI00029EF8C1|nr:DUF4365 domain-containing protein [Calothrix sp. PCC 7507]AFY33572.1 hypothetical protein Cal7507_3164 [Calothrix sp. PCC 7507]